MVAKIVLLIVASEGYQPIEYGHTRAVLEKAGIKVEVASNNPGVAQAKPSVVHSKNCADPQCAKGIDPEYASAAVNAILPDVDVNRYAGIFIVGGAGAMEFLDNEATYEVMQNFAKTGKPFGAICISTRILAKAGLLEGKKVTGWNGDNKLEEILKKAKAHYVKLPVVVDGNLITAEGPLAAQQFGSDIVKLIQR